MATFLVAAIALGAAVLLATETLRVDVVALLVMALLAVTGLVTPEQAFSGFSSSAVITILSIFILTAGLERTGVSRLLGAWLLRWAGPHETKLLLVVMVAGALLSLFMNTIAAAAVLLPVVMGVARETDVKPSKLLLPLSFAALLGGMATLLTTSNILASAVLTASGLPPFGVLDFLPVGIPIVIGGILYMLFIGRRWLPEQWPGEAFARRRRGSLAQQYELTEDVYGLYVKPGSKMAHASIAHAGWGEALGVNIVGLSSGGRVIVAPPPERVVLPGDIALVTGASNAERLREYGLVVTEEPAWSGNLDSEQVSLVEVLIAPRSTLPGKSLRDIDFRERYGLTLLAIWRAGVSIRERVAETPLRFGDALLLQGRRDKVRRLQADPEFLVLEESDAPVDPRKRALAAGIMAAALSIAAAGVLPVPVAVLAGALLMILSECLTIDEAYGAIEWRAIFLVAGMLPLGLALQNAGLADELARLVASIAGNFSPLVVVAGLLLTTALLIQLVGNVTAVVVLAPIAIATAQAMHASPHAFTMAVALGASMAFVTPVSHPVNVLVMGPGGYRARDYARVGWPLAVLMLGVVLLILPLAWPLR
ncbi:MAG: SLC13 family permease [Anaerolineales bacterium]